MSRVPSILAAKMMGGYLVDAAILLAHMMFGLPPAIHGEPVRVAPPEPVG